MIILMMALQNLLKFKEFAGLGNSRLQGSRAPCNITVKTIHSNDLPSRFYPCCKGIPNAIL
jgi:hypothetical protein